MHCIALDRETKTSIELLLVENVTNVPYLRENVINGKFNCCLVKPAIIVSPLQIAVAANKAAISQISGNLITKSLNSELLFNLSSSKNISQSLQTFGVTDKDQDCLVVVFHQGENKTEDIKSEINGEFLDIVNLSKFTDQKLIQKTYKIGDEELKMSTLASSVVSRIAVKELDLSR